MEESMNETEKLIDALYDCVRDLDSTRWRLARANLEAYIAELEEKVNTYKPFFDAYYD